MEFFKSNEEVIDLVLTPRGRELLSKGKFKPYSYTFHDIDIKYENSDGETQNNITTRIKETPRLKAPTYYANGDFYRSGDGSVIRKHNLAAPIADKTIGDQYAPAWKVKFLSSPDFQNYIKNGALITSKYYNINLTANTFLNIIENEGLEELIPQINVNYYYELLDVNNYVESPGGEKYIKTFLIEEKDILLEIDEINSFEENEINNFNLEIYLEGTDGEDKGKLIQLFFDKEIRDKTSVEKYLNILIDKNADFENLLKTLDIYGPGGRDTPTNC